mgnify:CR=1 FL=1
MVKIISLFALALVICLTASCNKNKTFEEFKEDEVVGSNRDGYARKIGNQYYFKFEYHDGLVHVYRMPLSDTKKWSQYAVNSIDQEQLCEGTFDYYATKDEMLYFKDSKNKKVRIYNQNTSQLINISIYDSSIPIDLIWKKI